MLDYKAPYYTLTLPRREVDVNEMFRDHGFDLSVPASTHKMACFFTKEPYAAVTFFDQGSDRARGKLQSIHRSIEASRATVCKRHFEVPAGLELADYQRADLDYMLGRTHSLDADEPGLGKTPTSICFANEIQAKRVLVIVPAQIRAQWERQIQRWTTLPWPYTIHTIGNAKHGTNPRANYTIVSYDLARHPAIGRALSSTRWDLLIVDEVHFAKNHTSKRARAILGGGDNREFDPFIEKAERVIALSGTPIPNRPGEAYTISRGLCFDAIDWLSEDRFKERFNPRQLRTWTDKDGLQRRAVDERCGRFAELGNRMRANFMARHLKRDVLPQLKLPIYDIVQADTTGPVKQALAAERLLDIDPEQFTGADNPAFGQVSTVRKQMGLALVPQAARYADMLLEGGVDKLVLFYWHVEVGDVLQKVLDKWGVVRVSGPSDKDAKVARFQKDPACHVAMGNLLSFGTGTDGLQEVSNYCFIAEPDWVPGNNMQAIERLDRFGQQHTVMADILVAPDSYAERILAKALRKGQNIHATLDKRF